MTSNSQKTDLAHARGALLGLAVGDALGTTLEFTTPEAPAFPALADGPHRDVVGGGPFAVRPGQVTDDTQMACALAASLRKLGRFDAADVAARYRAWTRHAFDAGIQTRAALAAVPRHAAPRDAGRAVWAVPGRRPAGNGSLMRTVPLAVFFAGDATALRAASLEESAITHFDPRCQLACASFNAAVAAALAGGASARELADVARAELAPAADALAATEPDLTAEIAAARAELATDLDAAAAADPQLYGRELHLHAMAGYVRVAFRLAFWELLHVPSFEFALVDVTNRGGDADTNGAIAGALLGACHGEDAIPSAWRARVLDVFAGETGPWATDYHPRVLLELLAG
jgi:ADP-ribosyl-[dinitrogen reductase] hydrolase